MSNSNTPQGSILDNYDPDAVVASRPIIKGLVRCRITDVRDLQQTDPLDPRIEIALQTDQDATDATGQPVPLGFAVTDFVRLSPPKNESKLAAMREIRAKHLKSFKMAVLALKEPEFNALPVEQRNIANKEQWVGKLVGVRFDSRADRNNPDALYQDIKGYRAASA